MVLKKPSRQALEVSIKQRYGEGTQQEHRNVKQSWKPPTLPPPDPRLFIADVKGNITVLPEQEFQKKAFNEYISSTTNSKFGHRKGSTVIYGIVVSNRWQY